MTGTQSLSFQQHWTIHEEVNRLEIAARRSGRWNDTAQGRVYTGQPVTIVIHTADLAKVNGRTVNVPEGTKGADKRVQIHRAFGGSETFWLDRNGTIIHRVSL